MSKKQAKFYLTDEVVDRLRHRSATTGLSMSSVVNLLVMEALPETGNRVQETQANGDENFHE